MHANAQCFYVPIIKNSAEDSLRPGAVSGKNARSKLISLKKQEKSYA